MKRILLSIAMFLVFGLWANAQTIENFESLEMYIFSGGTNGSLSVISNPDPTGVNTSGYVAKMIRGFDGDSWAGWYATLPTPVDVTANKYVHLKIWKPRISPVVFKYERSGGNSGDVYPIAAQTLINQWEELVFDMSMCSGEYVKIVLMPDFESPLTLTEDITLFYDEMFVNNDPTVGSAPVQMMEDFEHIQLNYFLGGAEDLSSMTMIENPDKSGVNLSDYVIDFLRDKDGVSWGGFWSGLPSAIDVTTNKYVHVKVWKPRISPIKFKIEGGQAGTIEVESMYPQTLTNAWEDIVFDFSDKTGTYPIINFLPDFVVPVGLTEDIHIYFDDIILNNDPNPITGPAQKISVDMTESGMTLGSTVWISGALGGIYGTWQEPGTNPNNEMLDTDGDGIYSITLSLPEGLVAFKFFWGTGWNNGDPAPGGDRTLTLTNTMDVLYKWGVDGIYVNPTIHWVLNMSYQESLGNFIEGTDYVDIAGAFNAWNGNNHHLTALGGGLHGITVEGFTAGQTIEYKFRINGSWATSEFPNGGPNRTHVVTNGLNEISLWYNDELPITDFTSDISTLCEGGSVSFEISNFANLIDSLLWNFPGGTPTNSFEINPIVSYANDGDYDVMLTAYIGINSVNVNKENYIHVFSPPLTPDKPVGDTNICGDQGFSEYNTTNLSSSVWELAPITAGTVVNNGNSYCQINWNSSFVGQASLQVKAVNICGESQFSDPLLINKTEPILIDLAEEIIICYGENQMLIPQVTGGVAPYSYYWEPSYHFDDPFSPTPIISPLFSDEIILNIVDANNCSKSKSSVITVEGENYNLAFTAFPYQFIAPPFHVQFNNLTPDVENYDFIWYFGNGDSSLLAQPTYTYATNGIYSVTLVATSKLSGCSDTFVKENYIECYGAGIDDAAHDGFRYFVDESNHTLNLSFDNQPDNFTFKLFSLIGNLQKTLVLTQKTTDVPLNNLPPGMYVFVIYNNDKQLTGKISIFK